MWRGSDAWNAERTPVHRPATKLILPLLFRIVSGQRPSPIVPTSAFALLTVPVTGSSLSIEPKEVFASTA